MKKYWIWLTQLNGIGPVKQRNLLDKFEDPLQIYRAGKTDLERCQGIGSKLAERIVKSRTLKKAETILQKARQNNIKLLTLNDPLYPEQVKQIRDTPVLLYYKGNILHESTGIAIVGARRCSQYGKKVTKRIVSYLAERNITVISGMAKGIDSYAHSTCLNLGGYTVAILGNGPDICYPSEHRELLEKLITQGAIISEFPPGTRPRSHNFPRRNRLISAWSNKVLVVEAGLKSGCLITARHASRQHREVLAVPGKIFSRESAGCNQLIQEGAEIYLQEEQLLSDEFDIDNQKVSSSQRHSNQNLESREKEILEILQSKGEMSLEELVSLTDIHRMRLVEIISLMEVRGIVKLRGSRCQVV